LQIRNKEIEELNKTNEERKKKRTQSMKIQEKNTDSPSFPRDRSTLSSSTTTTTTAETQKKERKNGRKENIYNEENPTSIWNQLLKINSQRGIRLVKKSKPSIS